MIAVRDERVQSQSKTRANQSAAGHRGEFEPEGSRRPAYFFGDVGAFERGCAFLGAAVFFGAAVAFGFAGE
jgi:hypothetical protein